MLPISIDLDGPLVVVPKRVDQPCLHSAPDAQIIGEADDVCSFASGHCGRLICGPVIDHGHVCLRKGLPDLSKHLWETVLLVVGRHHHEEVRAIRL